MSGLGAIVKSVGRTLEGAGAAAAECLRLALGGRRPIPCPVRIPVEAKRPRR